MRLLLDTNALVFYLYDRDELSMDVKRCLFDYSNTLTAIRSRRVRFA